MTFRRILVQCLLFAASACIGSTPPSTSLPAPEEGIQIPHQIVRDEEPRLLNAAEIQKLLAQNYPSQLRLNGLSGSVVLFLFVDASGRVTQVKPRNPSPHSEFNQAAERIARAMSFQPAEVEGEPLGVWILQRFDFTTR